MPFPPPPHLCPVVPTPFSHAELLLVLYKKGIKKKNKTPHAAVAINRRSISSSHPALGSQGVVLVLNVDVVVIVIVVIVPLSRGLS